MTNNFAVYVELDNGYCMVHSYTFIDADGQTSFEIYVHASKFYVSDSESERMSPIQSFD